MGMLDKELIFSDGQALTGAAVGDTPSTNSYDCAAGTSVASTYNGQGDNGLTGENLWLQIVLVTPPTSGGAATVQGVFQTSADGSTWVDAGSGPTILVSNITSAGYHLFRAQPPVLQNPGTLRYWRTVVRVAVAALTGGTVDSYVSNTIQRNIPRASAITV